MSIPAAIFVDLSNFYSRLVRCGIAPARDLREYFLTWLDFDLLADWLATSSYDTPSWVFYSGARLGAKSERVEGQYLTEYIWRINRLKGVTATDVQIPGQQREHATAICGNCGGETPVQWASEKGIDASLIVHLFDTCDSWEHAHLLSGDADFTPAVRSLRRRGKVVSGAGFTGASESLIRELHRFVALEKSYILEDFAAFAVFGNGGFAEQWLTGADAKAVGARVGYGTVDDASCSFVDVDGHPENTAGFAQFRDARAGREFKMCLAEHHRRLPGFDFDLIDPAAEDTFLFSPAAWRGVMRRLPNLCARFGSTHSGDSGVLSAK